LQNEQSLFVSFPETPIWQWESIQMWP